MQCLLRDLLERWTRSLVFALLRVTDENHVAHLEMRLPGAEIVGMFGLQVGEKRHFAGQGLVRLERASELLRRLVVGHPKTEKQRDEAHGRLCVLGANTARAHLFQKRQADEHAASAAKECATVKNLSHGALPGAGRRVRKIWLRTTAETIADSVLPFARYSWPTSSASTRPSSSPFRDVAKSMKCSVMHV